MGLALWWGAVLAAADAGRTRELLAQLQPDAPVAQRARACQQLAIVGTAEAVPALAALLADGQLGHYAREALEVMADPTADAALRDALGRLQGPLLVGVINSVGARGDVAAAGALGKIAAGRDAPAAAAALRALARIGTPESVALVRTELGRNRDAAAALLHAADRALAAGRTAEAAVWFDDVRRSGTDGAVKFAATRGAILARGAAGVPLLLEIARAGEPAMRKLAVQVMRELPGEPVTVALVAEFERLPADLQPMALAALVDRGGPAVLAVVERRAAVGDAVALGALGRIGGRSSLALLLRALPESAEARRSLVLISTPGADGLILRALQEAEPDARLKLIGILGDRGAVEATPELLSLARGNNVTVRDAALRALASTARPGDLPALIRLAAESTEENVRLLADRAIYGAAMKILEPERRVDPLLVAVRNARSAGEQGMLLRPLGAVVRTMGGSGEALTLLRELRSSAEMAVRKEAAKCLADWPDASPAVDLIAMAENEPEPVRSVALAGAVRLAGNVAAGRDKTPLDPLALLVRANRLVANDAERMGVVAALGAVRRIEALRMLETYLTVEAVKTEAALAIVQIAPPLLNGANGAAVRIVLERIAATERDADVRQRAEQLLKGAAPAQKKAAKKKQ